MIEARRRKRAAVRSQPVLPIEAVFARPKESQERPFPLRDPELALTYSGTAAVYQAFRALHLNAGSSVLCPSYNCGHEIEPLLRLGLRVECYRVTTDLQIDLEDVERRLRGGAKALMATHYFGFPQPLAELRELCDRHGTFLVEDCAHAFFSDNSSHDLGRVGDAAIYSLRKTLPIPNGGAVVFNNRALRLDDVLRPPPRMTTWLKSLDLLAKCSWDRFAARGALRDLLWLLVLLPLAGGSRAVAALYPRGSTGCYDPDDDDYRFGIEIMSWGISRFSARLLDRIDWSDVITRRRSNYRFLSNELADIKACRAILPSLPDYACPLYLPVWVPEPRDLYYKLARQRIFADVLWRQEHPAVDWGRYPEGRELKRHVLALPVHQDLDTAQLEHLAAALRAG